MGNAGSHAAAVGGLQAARWGWVSVNPAANASPPRLPCRALASDAIRGSLERHFGVTLAFQNCHRVAVFAAGAAGTEAYERFVSPRAQLLNQSPVLRDC